LRAAIEASAQGVKVGLICKSLLGKAHTVMAEGGMAAAMGNVDDRDNWKVHFADTMRGGQYVNNWRMAELHAKEAPARVHELEPGGRCSTAPRTAKSSSAILAATVTPASPTSATAPASNSSALSRTTASTRASPSTWSTPSYPCSRTATASSALSATDRERGRFRTFQAKAVVICTGGLGRAYHVTSNSWEGTGDGVSLAYHAGAELLDMEFIQFHPLA